MVGMVGWYVSKMNETQAVVIIILKSMKLQAVVEQGIWRIRTNHELRELYRNEGAIQKRGSYTEMRELYRNEGAIQN
jgi:hypothetical protein